ncbi:DUF881 domain-containing protein [Alkaliphilus serpentinus]|uniref:DUF881 domain-containing protein n=1 Tax=Alkaliphilus serpentinus TaxID=1482731 RepID=A0A833HP23_9FIRM|nr:DUF881 domain-containing protein [Alkaliphilus serpentinus]KAB3530262.1 DUF881 domain-containing protein [Alkaliphilus serpentinus]
MKNKIVHLTLMVFFILFGLLVGIQLNTHEKIQPNSFNNNINNDSDISEINALRKNNKEMRQNIQELEARVEEFEKERATESIPLKKLRADVNQFKLLSGHMAVTGPGIIITIEGEEGVNIAPVIDDKRYLINLVNELRVFGAEVITINDNRITARSEIIRAGNHINVNGMPISPPYTVGAIGDVNALKRYVEYRTLIFSLMSNDGIESKIDFSENMEIPKVTKEKPIQFYKTVPNEG